MVLLRPLDSRSKEVTGDEDDDEGEGGEYETGRSVSETSSTFLYTKLIDTSFIDYSISSLLSTNISGNVQLY
jgi:hypothetical protein